MTSYVRATASEHKLNNKPCSIHIPKIDMVQNLHIDCPPPPKCVQTLTADSSTVKMKCIFNIDTAFISIQSVCLHF